MALERQRDVNCTSPDNPNTVRFCDDMQNNIPFSKQFKLAGSYPLPYGIQLSGSFQSNQSPAGTSITFRCDYANTSSQRLSFGESALTNEMCIFSGQFHPAPAGGITCF